MLLLSKMYIVNLQIMMTQKLHALICMEFLAVYTDRKKGT